ncbi:MAG: hypothetical protein WCX47_01195 [Bacilli bacterium]
MEKKRLLLLGALPLMFALTIGAGGGNLAARAVTEPWAFDSKQDVLIDSFYYDTVNRELSATGAVDSEFSYAHLATNNAEASADNAIYKYASGTEKKDSTLFFEVKIDETVDIAKLHFNVRGGGVGTIDAWSTGPVALTATINEDGLSNTTISKGVWTTISISINNTFAGVSYGESGGTTSISVLGFSLYGDSTNTGFIDLRKVSVDTTIVDDFNRLGHQVPANAYWSGIDGTIIKRYVTLNNGTYTYKHGSVIDLGNVVLSLSGDLSGMSLALVDASGVAATAVAFASLQDRFGGALPTTLTSYTNVDINIASSGLTGDFAGIALSSTTELLINNFFASDCIVKETETVYPGLDVEDVSFVNDFNFSAAGPYSAAYSEAPAAFKAHGINFLAGYANADGITFDGENMVIPALTTGQDYGSLFLGMARDPEVKDYIVIQAKAEEGADFNNLRFNFFGQQTTALWLKDAKAGFGLPTLSNTGYPYVDEDGYSWLILSVAENEVLDPTKLNGEITVFWGHTAGTIKISSIFYANKAEVTYTGTIFNEALTAIDGYVYVGYIEAGVRYLELELIGGTGGGRTNTLALEQTGLPSKYLKDGELIGVDGQPLTISEVAEGETLVLKIDLLLSGYDTSKSEHYHSHWYAMGEVVTGSLSIVKRTAYMADTVVTPLIAAAAPLNPIAAGVGYAYLGGITLSQVSQHGDLLQLVITSDAAVTGGLDGVRIEMGSAGVFWFADNAEGSFLDANGALFSTDLVNGDNTFNISLSKTEIDPHLLGGATLHIHATNNTVTDLNLTVKSLAMVRGVPPITMSGLLTPDFTAPVITSLTTDKEEYEVGETVTLSTVASDNVSSLENLSIVYTVSRGSGDEYEEITVTDGTFVADEAATYTISVLVTDEVGNSATTTIQLVVEEDDPITSEPPTSEPPTSEPVGPEEPVNDGLGTGAIVGIVAGGVLVVGGLAYALYALLAKKRK